MARKNIAIVKSILEKMGKEFSAKISETRARTKLERTIDKDGLPEDIELKEDEAQYLKALGYEIEEDEEEPMDEEDLDDEEKEPSDEDLDAIEEDEDDEDFDEEDEDFDDEDEEPEPPKKKKKKIEPIKEKKKAPKKEKKKEPPKEKKATKKMNKYEAVCNTLKKKKNHTMESLTKEANDLYVKNGGNDNEKGTLKYVQYICKTLRAFGILEMNKEKIKML